jgi:transcriptional regulator with XRE-family HTH domain
LVPFSSGNNQYVNTGKKRGTMGEVSVLGKRVRAFRLRSGMSQNELAKRADVPRPVITRLEAGNQADVTLAVAMKLANALNVTVDMLGRADPLQSELVAAIA